MLGMFCLYEAACTACFEISIAAMFSGSTQCCYYCSFYFTEANKAGNKPVLNDLKKAAVNTMAAIAIGSSVLSTPVIADAMDMQPVFSSTNIVARTETREGLYQDYEIEVQDQSLDDARSTFKSAKETKSKKGQQFTAQ